MNNTNNIFDFATSELSQDAIIAWLCNWVNFPESKLFECSKKLIYMIAGNEDIDLSGGITVERQVNNIDVLVSKKDEWTIIIEDKIYSTHHSNQLNIYKNKIKSNKDYSDNIIVCYFKTGFQYDYDFNAFSQDIDVRITGEEFLSLLNQYVGISEILDDYIAHLSESCKWYSDIEEKLFNGNCVEAVSYQYGQHVLFKSIFHYENQGSPYLSYGSSRGRPWCQYKFGKIPSSSGTVSFDAELFYRADYKDKDNQKQPFVSLRQYYYYKEKDGDIQTIIINQKKEDFNVLRNIFEKTLKEFSDLIGIRGGNNGGYYESEFGIFYLSENSFETLNRYLMPFHLSFVDKVKQAFPSFQDVTRFI